MLSCLSEIPYNITSSTTLYYVLNIQQYNRTMIVAEQGKNHIVFPTFSRGPPPLPIRVDCAIELPHWTWGLRVIIHGFSRTLPALRTLSRMHIVSVPNLNTDSLQTVHNNHNCTAQLTCDIHEPVLAQDEGWSNGSRVCMSIFSTGQISQTQEGCMLIVA